MLIDIFSLKFTNQVNGIIHIGSHDCEERIKYLSRFDCITDNDIIWIDALKHKVEEMKTQNSSIRIFNECIGDKDNDLVTFKVPNNLQSSSFLKLKDYLIEHPDIHEIASIDMRTKTLKTFYDENKLNYDKYNFMALDIQGAELLALKGAGEILNSVEYIYIEVNTKELYENCALLPEIDEYLSKFGFTRDNILMTEHGWGDAFYTKHILNLNPKSYIKITYGIDNSNIDVTDVALKKCLKNNVLYIHNNDMERNVLFGDPLPGIKKYLYIINDNNIYTIDYNDYICIDFNNHKIYINEIPPRSVTSDYKILKPQYNFSIMAIFKNETMVLQTWLDHYLWQGVDHFYLIDNGSDDNPLSILQEYIDAGIVTYYFRPEKHQQPQHYRYVFDKENLKDKTKWLCICDLDEFFFGTEQKLSCELDNFNNYDVINTHSFFYGSDNLVNQPEDIRTAIVHRTDDTVNGVKYIFKPNCINNSSEIWIHWLVIPGTLQKTNLYNQTFNDTKIRLNHYITQSLEYFQAVKMTRGDVSTTENDNVRNIELFEHYLKTATIKDVILKRIIELNYDYSNNQIITLVNQKQNINTAVIVEPRLLKYLPFVINDFYKKLGSNWKIVFYCGQGLKNIWIDLLNNDNIEIRELNINCYKHNEYSDFLKSKEIWETVYGEYVLIFTANSIIMNEPPYTIDYFMSLNKSYIGGNQCYRSPELVRENIYFNYYNCQGGLTLRKRKDMIKIIETFPPEKTSQNYGESIRLTTDVEECYFTIGAYNLGLPIGDDEICSHFSVHTNLKGKFFGAYRVEYGYYINLIQKYDYFCDNIYMCKNITDIDNEILVLHPGGGFFSNCTMRLLDIVLYFNATKRLPMFIDGSRQFELYKSGTGLSDLTTEYFINKLDSEISIYYEKPIYFREQHQYMDYSKLDLKGIDLFISKYFTPNQQIIETIQFIENKYNISNIGYENICTLFYRGNDKITECELPSYEEIIYNAKEIQSKNPDIKFLIQSDEKEFIEKMIQEFPSNSFYFKDEIRTTNKNNNITVDKINLQTNFLYSQYYLAITHVMSKCKYVVCNTGNCSLWITLFRGNTENVFQHKYKNYK